MKVVVVDPWHFTPPYDRELCHGLANNGHQVTFVTSSEKGVADQPGADDRSGLVTLALFSAPARWLPRSLELVAKGVLHVLGMLRLQVALRRLKPDVVHFQWLSLPLVDALFLPWFRRTAPVVLTVHDSNPFNGSGPWLLRAGTRLAMQRCDRFVVHNQISEQRLTEQGLPADRIHRIAHGLLEQVTATEERPAARSDRKVRFLLFGKLKAYKGADILLEALARLDREARSKCHVSIVGRPYIDTQPLIDFVTDHDLDDVVDLRFDFVSDAEMADLFSAADYLVFPYRGIDTSGVLMAAVARGIPVIASDLGCFAETLTHGEEGVLVPPEAPEKLADALETLIASPDKQPQMAAKMRELRERVPSWNAIAKDTTIVYERAQMDVLPQAVRAHS